MTTNSLTQITVPFHSAELLILEHEGQPYIPMRPIVEGMGLDWATQFRKLNQKFKTCVVKMTTQLLGDNQTREVIMMALKKLPAFMYSIESNKVKPELRDTVIMYQNECDDVLWDYWTKGQAINHRVAISPEQQALLHEIVDRRSKGERKIYAEMWSRHNRHFKIPRYAELLAIHFPESVHYLETMAIKAKPEKQDNGGTLEKLQSFVDNLAHRYPTLQNPMAHEIAARFSEILQYQDLSNERLFYYVAINKGKLVVLPQTVHHGVVDLVKLSEAFEPLHNFMMGYEIYSQARALKKLPLKPVPR